MRAAATRKKLWQVGEKTGKEDSVDKLSILVQMVSDMQLWMMNASIFVPVWHGGGAVADWSEPGPPVGHSRADIKREVGCIIGATVGLERGGFLATTPADYVPMGCAAEPGPCEADMAEGGDPFSIQAASVCDGCWEVLPETCRCGAVRWCGHCADVFMGVGGEAEHGEGTGEVTMDMVRLELQRMAANVELVGSLGHDLREIDGRLDAVREQMATRDSYSSLLDRLRQLEGGVGSSTGAGVVEQDVFDEHSAYTEDEGAVSEYGYFDRDGNSIPSEDEDAEFEG